jgi:predicted AlkP superfamily phosphohydrolase/phosphomutase
MSVVNARDIRYERIWQILSRDGMRVGAMNVPCSYPPVEVNGFLIGGMLSPSIESDFTHPKGLIKEVIAHTGDYIIDLRSKHIPREQMRDELLRSTELRGAAMKYLLETHDLDFAMMVFTETDRAQHYFWADMDPNHPAWNAERGARFGDVIRRVYEAVDVRSAAVDHRARHSPHRVDHGFGRRTRMLHQRYLIEMGHRRRSSSDVGQKVWYATRDLLGPLDCSARAPCVTRCWRSRDGARFRQVSQMATKRSNIDRIIEASTGHDRCVRAAAECVST